MKACQIFNCLIIINGNKHFFFLASISIDSTTTPVPVMLPNPQLHTHTATFININARICMFKTYNVFECSQRVV